MAPTEPFATASFGDAPRSVPPPLSIAPRGAPVLGAIGPAGALPRLGFAPERLRRLVWMLALFAVLSQVTAVEIGKFPLEAAALVWGRRLIWGLVTLMTAVTVVRDGPDDLLGPVMVFAPMLLIGAISALLGIDTALGVVTLVFFVLTLLSATLLGRALRGTNLPAQVLVWFLVMLAVSIAVAYVRPKLATELDLRVHGGVWKGVFFGKNWLAWYAGFALLLATFARASPWFLRLAVAACALLCLWHAHSKGALVTLGACYALLAMFALWARFRLSIGLQLVMSTVVMLVVGLGTLAGYRIALAAIGRDVTLSGRTYIWSAYFDRALNSWLVGAGPGSFTELSQSTIDIGLRFQALGKIATPHNMYLAAFGEIGLIGAIAFVAAMVVIAVNAAWAARGRDRLVLPAFTLYFLLSGLDETHEVFGIASGLFLIVLLRAWQWGDLRRVAAPAAPIDIWQQVATDAPG